MYQRVKVTGVEGVPDGEVDLLLGGDWPWWLVAFQYRGRRWTKTVHRDHVSPADDAGAYAIHVGVAQAVKDNGGAILRTE